MLGRSARRREWGVKEEGVNNLGRRVAGKEPCAGFVFWSQVLVSGHRLVVPGPALMGLVPVRASPCLALACFVLQSVLR